MQAGQVGLSTALHIYGSIAITYEQYACTTAHISSVCIAWCLKYNKFYHFGNKLLCCFGLLDAKLFNLLFCSLGCYKSRLGQLGFCSQCFGCLGSCLKLRLHVNRCMMSLSWCQIEVQLPGLILSADIVSNGDIDHV